MAWDRRFDDRMHALVVEVCSTDRPAGERDAAWRQLMVAIAPHVEVWARQGRALRRCHLDNDDDVRAVMVALLARLARRDFANLRQFLARQPHADDDVEEAMLIEALAGLARADHDAPRASPTAAVNPAADERDETPLRGWLVALTRFVAKDHVKQRLGWSAVARTRWGIVAADPTAAQAAVAALDGVLAVELQGDPIALDVEYVPGRVTARAIGLTIEQAGARVVAPPRDASKRDVSTDAEPWDAQPEAGERPAITDAIAMRAILVEIRGFVATLPPPMPAALELWLADHDHTQIATRLGLQGAGAARALIRAAQARLRARFRDRWPELCAA